MKERTEEMIRKELEGMLGEGRKVQFAEYEKNNGVAKQSIVITAPGENVTPSIHVGDYVKRVEAGEIGVHEAADEILDTYRRASSAGLSVALIRNRDYILGNVICQLVNREMNEGTLLSMPHMDYLDLAVVYRVVLGHGTDEKYSFLMKNSNCEALGITLDEIDRAARKNTKEAGIIVQSMAEVLSEMLGSDPYYPEESPMYVGTNQDRMYGAAAMLFPDSFSALAEKVGSDLFIMPSSIHELIAVPADGYEPEELRCMVTDINTTVVEDEEILGNSVYRYSRATGQISIACAAITF